MTRPAAAPPPSPQESGPTARVLVVGAGPAGLATARALLGHGVGYDHVERHTEVGGIWDIEAPGSPMYDAAHFISSKTLSGFDGFPMPDDYPDYPSHRLVLAYLRSFADAYGLTERIRFGTGVDEVAPATGGGYDVRFADGTTAHYEAVVCCTGAQWQESMPELPGAFPGTFRHSRTYRSAEEVAGRRVLVIGGGNSACDIAVDASRTAERVVISMRRGYWFIPKHIFGMPSDVFGSSGPHLPMWLQQRAFGAALRLLVGDPTKVGLQRPDHRLFETHPVLNSNLHHSLQHGDVVARPGIAAVDGHRVTFTDGTQEEVDEIIAATGYRHGVPYATQLFGPGQPDLYLTSFSREREGLFGIGFTETNSGAYVHFDELAQMVAAHLADRVENPARYRRFRQQVRTDRPDLSGGIRFDGSPRHEGYVDADALTRYRRRLVRDLGWVPRLPTRRATSRRTASRPVATGVPA